MNSSMCHLSVTKLQTSVDIMRYYEWPKVKKYLNKRIHQAANELQTHANYAKNVLRKTSFDPKKLSLKNKKSKKAVYTVNRPPDEDTEDDGYPSWGSDFDCDEDSDSVSDCGEVNDGKDDDTDLRIVDVDEDDDNVRSGSYTFTGERDENDPSSSSSASSMRRSSHSDETGPIGPNFENTYEAISETPSTSSYCGGSENSSSLYETPSEGRSCRSDEVDDHHHLDDLDVSSCDGAIGGRKSDLSMSYPESDYADVIKRESSEETSSSGIGSEPSLRVRVRSIKKPDIPPKPNIFFRPNIMPPVMQKKVRKKVIRPPEHPPPPPSSTHSLSSPANVSSSSICSTSTTSSSTRSTSLVKSLSAQTLGGGGGVGGGSSGGPRAGCTKHHHTAQSSAELTLEDLDEVLQLSEVPNELNVSSTSSTATTTNSIATTSSSSSSTPTKSNKFSHEKSRSHQVANSNHDQTIIRQQQQQQQQQEVDEAYLTPIYITRKDSASLPSESCPPRSSSSSVASSSYVPVPSSSQTNSNSGVTTRVVDTQCSSKSGTIQSEIISPPISPPPQFGDDEECCCSCKRTRKRIGSTPNLHQDRRPDSGWPNKSLYQLSSPNNSYSASSLSLISSHQPVHDRPKLPKSKITSHTKSTAISLASKLTEKAAKAGLRLAVGHRSMGSIRTESTSDSSNYSNNNHHHHHQQGNNKISTSNCDSYKTSHKRTTNSVNNLAQRPLPPLPDSGESDYVSVQSSNEPETLDSYPWFHNIERDQAAVLLKKVALNGTFIVRPSRSAGMLNPFTLTVYHEGKVFNLNIRKLSDESYALGKEKEREQVFSSVPQLIAFYQKEQIILATKGDPISSFKLESTLNQQTFAA
ncbi:uncharacterized protein LOC141851769 [Brevipalpus obovatus]|uniref:uncharacterized protein LOC141851769 n=1 Tax=Brevipalpus obovatus TaxID=246614 RepID=UPI003D9F7D95